MPRPPVVLPPSVFPLAHETDRPLRWRLHQGLKAAILGGQFEPGARLPSTRALAGSFGMSRATVVEAFDQLAAEGFIERHAGSGTYVSRQLDGLCGDRGAGQPPDGHARRTPAQRVQPLIGSTVEPVDPTRPVPFTPCEPDVTQFPHQLWARMLGRHARAPDALRAAPHPTGLPRLRTALAAHLGFSRGVRADPDQIVVVSGARQALHLATQILLDPGDSVWFEDPAYPATRSAFSLGGIRVVPVPVDGQGIDVGAGRRLAPHANAAYVTPSHQFPTGALMGLSRRLQLLDWAAQEGAWVFEDDYDSEFCYDNRPLPALQGLDEQQSVVYLGTLNKVAYPALRVGYLVAPPSVVPAFEAVTAAMPLGPSAVIQAALADFIAEGHLARHVARMRTVYQQRQQIIVDELGRHLSDHVSVEPSPVGMHIVATLHGVAAEAVAEAGRANGLDLRALSSYAMNHDGRNAIIIGYTHLDPDVIKAGVRDLARLVTDLTRR
jgi:GntR family transcriptional regulator/MocR family aminotransferase